VPAVSPVEAVVASPEPKVGAAETDVATTREANARDAAGTDTALASATGARRDDATLPPAPLPVDPSEATSALRPQISAAPAPVGLTPGSARAVPVPLTRTVRVRVSPWRARLLADTILPTAPMPLARSEPVALLRTRLLAEKEAHLPQPMREPRARWGLALDLGTTGAEEVLTWQDADGIRPEGSSATGGRAEVSWAPSPDGVERQFRLSRRDGAFVAEVAVAADGREFTVRTTEEMRAWLLLAVDVLSGDRRAADQSGTSKPYVWRSGAADSPPSGWIEREDAFARGEAIAEVPLGGLPGAAALQGGALFDPESGWAIVADVRQAADRPLGN
jgi:hypothetical protein